MEKDLIARFEQWAWAPGYEGLYQVSDAGRLKSYLRREDGRILSTKTKPGSYVRIGLVGHDGIRRTEALHKLVAKAFLGDIPPGYQVHHIDADPGNNRANNLEILDAAEHSQRTLAANPNLAAALIRYTCYEAPRTVLQCDMDGNILARYHNAKVAADSTGVCHRDILLVAGAVPYDQKGHTRRQAGGYVWRFEENGI